ncbi:hypothetical protein [Streptomyces sp. NBC_00691]|uniref:hypothetical protein n=1 Tax=Streptomyces sp. NBC_00691 TaxID=2903671 RepID=UPI002E324C7C|nr:hypothetical protein [Streptomyces sp. NBC_00691]
MTQAFTGMTAGIALAFAACFGGAGAFLLVATLGGAGWAIGSWFDSGGRVRDLRESFERGRR